MYSCLIEQQNCSQQSHRHQLLWARPSESSEVGYKMNITLSLIAMEVLLSPKHIQTTLKLIGSPHTPPSITTESRIEADFSIESLTPMLGRVRQSVHDHQQWHQDLYRTVHYLMEPPGFQISN